MVNLSGKNVHKKYILTQHKIRVKSDGLTKTEGFHILHYIQQHRKISRTYKNNSKKLKLYTQLLGLSQRSIVVSTFCASEDKRYSLIYKVFEGFSKKTSDYLELIARDIRIFDTFYLPYFFIHFFKINRLVYYSFTRIIFFIKPWFIFNISIFRYTHPRIIMNFPHTHLLDNIYVSLFNKAFGGSI